MSDDLFITIDEANKKFAKQRQRPEPPPGPKPNAPAGAGLLPFLAIQDARSRDDLMKPQSPEGTALARRFLDNVLQLPDTLNTAGNRAQSFVNEKLTGVLGPDIGNVLVGPVTEDQKRALPFDMPSGLEVLGGMEALFSDNSFEDAVRRREQLAIEHPVRTIIGEGLGDAAAIGVFRAPLVGMRGGSDILAPSIMKGLEKIFRPGIPPQLGRVFGRSIEGGLEATYLALRDDGDVIGSAALAAGTQAAGLGLLAVSKIDGASDVLQGRLITGGGKMFMSAVAIAGLLEAGESLFSYENSVPGSIEAGFDKIPIMIALGAIGGLTGAGRVSGDLPILKASVANEVADMITTIPRASMLSALNKFMNDPQAKDLASTFVSNADQMTAAEQKKFVDAFVSNNLTETIPEIMESVYSRRDEIAGGPLFIPVE